MEDCSECLSCPSCFEKARDKNESTIKKLIEKGLNPDYTSPNGRTSLMVATRLGNIDGVNDLLKYGANPFLIDDYGMTALVNFF